MHENAKELVARLIAGDRAAAARFADLADVPVWSTVVALMGNNADGREAYSQAIAALSAHRFARLARYDGRASLVSFLVLEVRSWLTEQTAGMFARDPTRAWPWFERLFRADFTRLVGRHFPRGDAAEREDRLQDVRARLIEDDYRRIRAYKGDRAFGGFILVVVDHLLRDLKRQDIGRLRLPERIARLSPLHRAVFRAGAWHRVTLDVQALRAAVLGQVDPEPTLAAIDTALREVAPDIRAARDALDAARNARRPASLDGEEGASAWHVSTAETPEAHRLRAEEERSTAERLAWALRRADTDLRPLDRAYLRLVAEADGEVPPARTIAALLGVPVQEVYGAATRIKRWGARLRETMTKSDDPSV